MSVSSCGLIWRCPKKTIEAIGQYSNQRPATLSQDRQLKSVSGGFAGWEPSIETVAVYISHASTIYGIPLRFTGLQNGIGTVRMYRYFCQLFLPTLAMSGYILLSVI
jgi:hypothetical protein